MEEVTKIKRFLFSGYGYGSGYGSGSGYGYGYGSGDGYCYGYGDGDGYGSGDGSGDGYCYGSGYGDGSGSGDGDGYGDGVKTINGETVWQVDRVPTLIDSVRGYYAQGRILNKDLTLTPCYIARVENSFAHGATLREAVADATEKAMDELPEEERIERFCAEFPTLETKATCATFFAWHHVLTGSCKMGRESFVKDHDLDMDKEYTVAFFLDITADAYGGETINKLRKSYGK